MKFEVVIKKVRCRDLLLEQPHKCFEDLKSIPKTLEKMRACIILGSAGMK